MKPKRQSQGNSPKIGRRLISALRIVGVGLWTLVWTTTALAIYLVTRRHRLPLVLARRVWAPGVITILGCRLEVEGGERVDYGSPHLFVANHASQLDIPVSFAALPVSLRFLAKEELRRVPLVGHYITAMGMVFIDRRDPAAARHSIDRLAELLASGASLMAFPEGTRSRGGEIRPFKTGAFVAAIKAGVPVVPICIRGTSRALPAGSMLVAPGRLRVVIGEPIDSAELDLDDRRQLADRAREQMLQLEDASRQPVANSRT